MYILLRIKFHSLSGMNEDFEEEENAEEEEEEYSEEDGGNKRKNIFEV